MKFYALREDVGNAMIQYLAKRPYEEVFPLVRALQSLNELVNYADPTPTPVAPFSPVSAEVIDPPAA